jgi:single-strand DNA-binding protein
MNLNKVFLLGRVTADPQLRSTPSGMQVATFSIATNRVWNDQSGAKKESTEFHNVVVWGRQAEVASRFLKKGSLVLVEGRLQTREWEGKDGQKRRTTEIICERMQLGPRPMGGSSASGSAGESREELPTVEIGDGEIKSEDLPF